MTEENTADGICCTLCTVNINDIVRWLTAQYCANYATFGTKIQNTDYYKTKLNLETRWVTTKTKLVVIITEAY